MTADPLISVLMTVLRPDPAHLREAVRGVLAQTHANLELVVVEDPSDVPAGPVLAAFADPRVRHVLNPERTSHTRQRNQTLALARGELAAVLDGDDIALPDRLREQAAAFAADPELAVLGGQVEIIDTAGGHVGWRAYPTDAAAVRAALRRFNPFTHSAVMMRRGVVLGLGGYRYAAHPACEDYDLWCRVARAGGRMANLPSVLVKYRNHGASLRSRKVRGVLRGTVALKRTHFGRELTFGDRLRLLAERALVALPPAVTMALFEATQFRRSAPPPEAAR